MMEGSSSEVTPMPGGIVSEDNSNHSASPSSAELHPLQNPMILAHLFELCPSGLLSKFRLISREWHCISLAPWRSSFPLTISYRDGGRIFVINRNEQRHHSDNTLTVKYPLVQFLEYLQNPANDCVTKPFRQLLLESWRFRKSFVPQAGWNILGHGVTKLTLNFCHFKGIGELCELLQQLFPNLKSLSLGYCFFKDHQSPDNSSVEESVCGGHLNLKSLSVNDSETSRSYIDYAKLVSNFPSLTNLSMLLFKIDRNVIEIERVLHVITTMKRIDKSKFPIKALNLSPRLELSNGPASLEKFVLCQRLNIPLQSIRIRIYPNLDERVIEEIVRFHGGTLNKITALEDPSNPTPSYWKFPFNVELKTLQELKISGSLLDSLEFLKYTPKLVLLDIRDVESDDYMFSNTGTEIVSNTLKHGLGGLELTGLSVLKLRYAVSNDDIRCLIKWMPNIDTMTMVLNDTQFGMVCDGWRHLKELEVQGPELTDVGVTGNNPSGPDHHQVGVEAGEDLSVVEGTISPNITLLQDLRRFVCWSSKLTDTSVFNGFLKLDNLEFIRLYSPCSGPERTRLGEEARTAIWDKMERELTCYCFSEECEFLWG